MKIYFTQYDLQNDAWLIFPSSKGYLLYYPSKSLSNPHCIEFHVEADSHVDALNKAQSFYSEIFSTPDRLWKKDFGQL